MITVKLSPTNYLIWRNQILPILAYQKLSGHITGDTPAPTKTLTAEGTSAPTPNPAYTKWLEDDQKAFLILQSSLTEAAMAETLGVDTAAQVWRNLERAYRHDSHDRMHTLKDNLRRLKKGTSPVSDYSSKFRSFCDQLSAIGHPIDEIEKNHLFLCGLGSSFEHFSTTYRAIKPTPSFLDLVAQAESHELFLASIQDSPPVAAFTAQRQSPSRGGSSSRGRGRGSSNNGGRGRGRRPPHCQLCRTNGHYANSCPDLASFARQGNDTSVNLAQAFHAQCHVNDRSPDWYVDSGATAHMTPSTSTLDSATPYNGQDQVAFGNEARNKGNNSQG